MAQSRDTMTVINYFVLLTATVASNFSLHQVNAASDLAEVKTTDNNGPAHGGQYSVDTIESYLIHDAHETTK